MGLWDAIRNCFQQLVDTAKTAIRQPIYPAYQLTDVFGRTVVIHGMNICNGAKRSPGHTAWHTYEDLKKYVTEWGFNGARVLVFWGDVEPTKGVYNDEYLKKVSDLINNLKRLGVWVLVDFHQDIYSEKFGGCGAPTWAIHDHGYDYSPVEPWALNYLQPAVMTAFQNFWNTNLKDDYLNMVKYAVDKFKALALPGGSNILAIDIMNEPFDAHLFSFESTTLTQFYKDAAYKMPNERIAAEPSILADAGLPSSLAFSPGSGKGLFVPHYYDAVFEAMGYNEAAEQIMWTAMRGRVNDANRMGMPLLIGEVGAKVNKDGRQQYVDQFMKVCDAHTTGWMWYCHDKEADSDMGILTNDGKEQPIMQQLVQVYARAIGGTEPRWGTEGKKFTVTWKKLAGVTAPTEIYIPPRFGGIQVLVNGVAKTYTPSPARPNILTVTTSADNMKVEVLWA